ncbi:MAG: hypothetical protein F9K46_02515 [Anaerolineae bacterium]|nr:MAG: hypothetical protein F9K46_02515 [Anaerolineae bacterium]
MWRWRSDMETNSVATLIALPLALSPAAYIVERLNRKIHPGWLALLILALAWGVFGVAANEFDRDGTLTYRVGMMQLQLDGLSLLACGAILTLGTLTVIYSLDYMAEEGAADKYYALVLLLLGTMMGLVCTRDLFNVWVWFEAMAISASFLVAFYREQPASLEAGVKYIVQSALGSAFILLGIALVLAETGTLDLQEIAQLNQDSAMLWAAGGLFIAGFGVKMALVPFHTWLPDAHAQAPSGISALLSGLVIEVALIALLRALTCVAFSWGTLLIVFGVVNMLVGNLLALRQTQIKRLLAYSSLSQMGYMVFGIGIGIYAQTLDGFEGGLFHFFNHALMKGLAFLAVGAFIYSLETHQPLQISALRGASRRYPYIALALSLALLGLGGLPPLAGFMSKWQIFAAGIAVHEPLITLLVIFAALNSVLSLAYYAPIINVLYSRQAQVEMAQGRAVPRLMRLSLLVLSGAIVVIGVYPGLLHGALESAARVLLTAFGG